MNCDDAWGFFEEFYQLPKLYAKFSKVLLLRFAQSWITALTKKSHHAPLLIFDLGNWVDINQLALDAVSDAVSWPLKPRSNQEVSGMTSEIVSNRSRSGLSSILARPRFMSWQDTGIYKNETYYPQIEITSSYKCNNTTIFLVGDVHVKDEGVWSS